jgi:sensor histidine kinase YesM
MVAQSPNRLVAWLKRTEARADAWAARRLSAEEYADAVVLDAQLKHAWKRWLAIYLAVTAAASATLMILAPAMGWMRAVIISNILFIGLLGVIVSAWYKYSRFVGRRARKSFAIFLLMLFAGGVTGAIVASLDAGRPITEMSPEKIGKIFSVVAALGGVLVAAIAGIAYLRSREVRQRVALLQAEADRERLARQAVQAELKLLQAQVEPHFLFNTLANLRFLVQSGSPQALTMLDHLIHYLRTALPEIRAESSTVGREVELAHAYLEILRIRMGGALEIETDAPRDIATVAFPPLVVLTLVENAIKHGIAPLGKGRVSVRGSAHEGRLRVTVEDDGRGLAGPIGQGVGLGNVRERLAAIYGETARLELTGRAGGGTTATIEVPL